jgi:hypothetical protein
MIQPREDGPLRLALRDDNRDDNSGSVHVVVRPVDVATTND